MPEMNVVGEKISIDFHDPILHRLQIAMMAISKIDFSCVITAADNKVVTMLMVNQSGLFFIVCNKTTDIISRQDEMMSRKPTGRKVIKTGVLNAKMNANIKK